MTNVVLIMLSAVAFALSMVCMNLTQRLRRMEKLFLEAAERLGEPQYE